MIIQRLFSSKEQKARRAKWEIENGVKPGTEEYIRNSAKGIKKKTEKAGINLSEKDAINAAKKRLSRGDGGEFKAAMNEGRWRTMDALHGTNDNIKRNGVDSMGITFDKLNFKRHIKESKPSTDLFKKEAEEDYNKRIKPGLDRKEKNRQIAELGNKKGKEAAAKRDSQIKQENSKLRNEFRNRVKEYKEEKTKKAAESKASIAKHEAKAAELRAKKEAGKMLKKGGKIALATGGAIAAGVGAKKLYDKKKKDSKKEKESQ